MPQDLESFHQLILYVTMVSGDGRPFPEHVVTATSTALDKTSLLRSPPASLPPLDPIKGQAGGSTRRRANGQAKASHHPTVEDQHLKQSLLYSHFFETWDLLPLSQLVTPTQALRCKEIQYSPLSTGRRAFFCPNQDKPPCTLLASPSILGTRNTDSLIGLGPSRDQTPTVGAPGRGLLRANIIFSPFF
jgi:hypothetical protein